MDAIFELTVRLNEKINAKWPLVTQKAAVNIFYTKLSLQFQRIYNIGGCFWFFKTKATIFAWVFNIFCARFVLLTILPKCCRFVQGEQEREDREIKQTLFLTCFYQQISFKIFFRNNIRANLEILTNSLLQINFRVVMALNSVT